jgi:trimeric autotransporter adhesin
MANDMVVWRTLLATLVSYVLGSQTAFAASFSANCASCHGMPTQLLSQDTTYGKILPRLDIGTLSEACSATTPDCALRLKIRNNVNMGSSIESVINDADMDGIRNYLLNVRNAAVTSSGGTFPPTAVGSESVAVVNVNIDNYRGLPLGYSFNLTGSSDFSVISQSAPSCSSSVAATASTSPSSCSVTLNLKFKPLTGGAGVRSSTLNLNFAGNAVDPTPLSRSIPLSATAFVQAPVFSIPSNNIQFSAVVGTPSIASSTITNTGDASLQLSSLVISGTAASDYSFAAGNTCTTSLTLLPAANCQLVLAFNPAAAGAHSANLSITHNATDSPSVLALQGTATAAPQPAVALSTSSLAFGDRELGGNAQQSFTLCNNGQAPLIFSSFTWAGASSDYTRTGTCAVNTPLAFGPTCTAANSCTVTVAFAPSVVGARNAALTTNSNASNGSATVNITGSGVPVPASQVSLSLAELNFGAQSVGGLYLPRSVVLTNSGTASLALEAVSINGAAFTLTNNTPCPSTLAPASSCTIETRFTPPIAGINYSGDITITDNATGSPHRVALQGSGSAVVIPVLAWSPAVSSLEFGDAGVGTPSAVQTATLLNQGPGGVILNLVNTVGADAANYSVTLVGCSVGQTVFEGQTCQVNAQFNPSSLGKKSAAIQVASTGSLPPILGLNGTGLGGPNAQLQLSATKLAFADTRVGAQSLPMELTLSSKGSGAVHITQLAALGPYTIQRKSCASVPFTLPPGAECTVTISFQPTAEGASFGTLRISSDASNAPQEVALSGNAVPAPDVVGSGGGCSVASGQSFTDPVLWTMVLAAVLVLLWRSKKHGISRPSNPADHL